MYLYFSNFSLMDSPSSSDSDGDTVVTRHVPPRSSPSSSSSSSTRFHPYLPGFSSLTDPRNSEKRIELLDELAHMQTTLCGYLRRLASKKEGVRRGQRAVLEEEVRIRTLQEKMENSYYEFMRFTASQSPAIPPVAIAVNAPSTPSPRAPTPPIALPTLAPQPPQPPPVIDSRIIYEVGPTTFAGGVLSHLYDDNATCDLCEEKETDELLQCRNDDCNGRICENCFKELNPLPRRCPYCRAFYERRRQLAGNGLWVGPAVDR